MQVAAKSYESAKSNLERLLFLVHPGSVCGSANFNIGESKADWFRAQIQTDLDQWHGGIIVLDGELSDELTYYPELSTTINNAVYKAHQRSQISVRARADDPDHVDIALNLLRNMKLPQDTPISITGWASWRCVRCATPWRP